MNYRHSWQLKKSKSWMPFWSFQVNSWSCQVNSTANPAHLPQNWATLAKSAVLFSWWVQNGSRDFDFFNCSGFRMFILFEIHWDQCQHIFQGYYFFYRYCDPYVKGQLFWKVTVKPRILPKNKQMNSFLLKRWIRFY